MPILDKEYINIFLLRLEDLMKNGRIGLIQADNGSYILVEMWHYPERKESDPENEYEIYPIAKLLTEEEVEKLKFDGVTPKVV